eukprot:UN31917
MITTLIWLIGVFNLTQLMEQKTDDITLTEYVSPFIFTSIIWFVLTLWCSINYEHKPEIGNYKKRLIKFHLNFQLSEKTKPYYISVLEYVNNYGKLQNTDVSFSLPILLGVIFASLPLFVRLCAEEPVFGTNADERLVILGAMFVNFTFCFGFLAVFDYFYTSNVKNYATWMHDMTYLLSKDDTEDVGRKFTRSLREAAKAQDSIELKTLRGAFLSFENIHNVTAWLELRSFFRREGQYLFVNQEVSTMTIVVICMVNTVGVLCVVLFSDDVLYFIEGLSMSFLAICYGFGLLARIWFKGRKISRLQRRQIQFMIEQRMFIMHNLLGSTDTGQNVERRQTIFYEHNDEPTEDHHFMEYNDRKVKFKTMIGPEESEALLQKSRTNIRLTVPVAGQQQRTKFNSDITSPKR